MTMTINRFDVYYYVAVLGARESEEDDEAREKLEKIWKDGEGKYLYCTGDNTLVIYSENEMASIQDDGAFDIEYIRKRYQRTDPFEDWLVLNDIKGLYMLGKNKEEIYRNLGPKYRWRIQEENHGLSDVDDQSNK